ncbi:MAG: nucleotidyltransferase domain-containing protein [Chloroflexi bacterium]|nr:nucleotidyltransferase domain-containing protein [Chloroflexota bacterium]
MTNLLHTLPDLPGLGDVERRALRAYAEYTLSRYGDQVEALVLFGSHARGEATPDSDIDLLVVLDGGRGLRVDGFYPLGNTDPVWCDIVEYTFDVAMKYGAEITSLVVSQNEYQQNTPLFSTIRKEGIPLWSRR